MFLATLGDLIDDLVVSLIDHGNRPDGPADRVRLRHGADTLCVVSRRRGGSAANVAAAAAGLGVRARFISVIGADNVGRALASDLAAVGVDVVGRTGPRTATVIALLDPDGERSMLTDRGSAVDLDQPERRWLDGVTRLHVPLYSLAGGALAATTRTLIAWASSDGLPVSIDASATSLIEDLGPGAVVDLLAELGPDIVFGNEAEAAMLAPASRGPLGTLAFIEKRGANPAVVHPADGGSTTEVAALDLGPIGDTVGAGDAFAAGFLVALDTGADLSTATTAGHHAAAAKLTEI